MSKTEEKVRSKAARIGAKVFYTQGDGWESAKVRSSRGMIWQPANLHFLTAASSTRGSFGVCDDLEMMLKVNTLVECSDQTCPEWTRGRCNVWADEKD